MTGHSAITPMSVLLPISIGTGLSLIGDASLYAVLPTHVGDAGITLAGVGIILSANRFIRLLLNGPAGMAYDRFPRRPLFIAALFLGGCSTAIYALGSGFWSLLSGRLLWGLSWAGIWVGGNAMIVDISENRNRGRWVGLYNICFFLGTSSGSALGGLLTDRLGYHAALGAGAGLTFAGAVVVWILLPETSRLRQERILAGSHEESPSSQVKNCQRQIGSAFFLMGVNRFSVAGVLMPTFGLFLLENLGGSFEISGIQLGVASATGLGLGLTYLISMISAPAMGWLSDRCKSRWQAVAWGLLPGAAGFMLLAMGHPATILLALLLTSFAAGSNQGLSIAIVGDLCVEGVRGRTMGFLFTVGDLASAVGPLLAYALAPVIGLKVIYVGVAALLAAMMALAWYRARNSTEEVATTSA